MCYGFAPGLHPYLYIVEARQTAVHFEVDSDLSEEETPDLNTADLALKPHISFAQIVAIAFTILLVGNLFIINPLPPNPLVSAKGVINSLVDYVRHGHSSPLVLNYTSDINTIYTKSHLSPESLAILVQLAEERVQRILYGPVMQRDYALAVDGGKISCRLTSGCRVWRLAMGRWSPPDVILDENTQMGNCWSIPVQPVQVGVVLAQQIHPTHIVIDHIPRDIAADILQAPHSILVWGIVEGAANVERLKSLGDSVDQRGPTYSAGHVYVLLARFEYDIHAQYAVQAFPVIEEVRLSEMDFGVIVMEMEDNWGSDTTCIYRVRIHGIPSI